MNKLYSPHFEKRGLTLSLSNLTYKISKKLSHKYGFANAQLFLDWPLIVGHTIALQCKPLKVVYPKNSSQGRLYLGAAQAAVFTLNYHKDIILEKIRIYLGKQIINEITFSCITSKTVDSRHIPPLQPVLTINEVDAAIEGFPEGNLKTALISLGLSLR